MDPIRRVLHYTNLDRLAREKQSSFLGLMKGPNKYSVILELVRLARAKQSSLLGKFVSYKEN
jgi:hypothetical protein